MTGLIGLMSESYCLLGGALNKKLCLNGANKKLGTDNVVRMYKRKILIVD